MKTPVTRTSTRSPPPTTPSFYTYLKPGALAKLRYSKITARSRRFDAQKLFALCQLNQSSHSDPRSVDWDVDKIPCFNLRRVSSYTRCIKRKKLIAVTPFFSEAQS